MVDTLEYKGRWRVPNKDIWYNGTLKFDPIEGIYLELFGTFNPGMFDRATKELILGETTDGDITLVDNYYKTHSHTISSEISIGKYKPTFIIQGHHFEKTELIKFNKVTFKSFNLFEWLEVSGLTHDINKTAIAVNYSKPENLLFDYFMGCNGSIEFHNSVSLEIKGNKTEIEEQCSVTLNYDESRHFKDILMDTYVFNGFITLMTFEQSYLLTINLSDPAYLKEGKVKLIQCIYHNPSFSPKYKIRRKGEYLIEYKTIKNDFPLLIASWYKKYHEINPVFSLMLYSFEDKFKFSEDKFMDIVRAIETFHRRTTTCTKIPVSEYKSLISRVLNKVDDSDRKWLIKNNSLTYANELSLKQRLLDLIKNYANPYLLKQIPNQKRFCVQVVDSRNYYTHYSPEKEKVALKGKDLFDLNQKLKSLLILCICKHIGISNNEILNDGLRRNL